MRLALVWMYIQDHVGVVRWSDVHGSAVSRQVEGLVQFTPCVGVAFNADVNKAAAGR
jgi:hypothetical protein